MQLLLKPKQAKPTQDRRASKRKRVILVGAAMATGLVLIPATPAQAFLPEWLQPILGHILKYFQINDGGWLDFGIEAVANLTSFIKGDINFQGLLGPYIDEIAGALGLPDPNKLDDVLGDPNHPENPFGEIESPEEAYLAHGTETAMSSEAALAYVATVLGDGGQQRTADSLAKSGSYHQTASDSLNETAKNALGSVAQAQLSSVSAANSAKQAIVAQTRLASQDVLKDISSQLAYQAALGNTTSNQLSILSNQSSIKAGQLAAIAGSQSVTNGLLADLKLGQAYAIKETTRISQALHQMNESEKDDDRRSYAAASHSANVTYVPGLAEYVNEKGQ